MSRTYLLQCLAVGINAPFSATVVLQDDETFDLPMLAKVEKILLQEQYALHPECKRSLHAVKVFSFRPFEVSPGSTEPLGPTRTGMSQLATLATDPEIQLNDCGTVLPPVESRLVIEIAPGVLLKAMRNTHAASRDDKLEFHLEAGGTYIGRPRWTHA